MGNKKYIGNMEISGPCESHQVMSGELVPAISETLSVIFGKL